jgi:hypothetical protein
MVATTLYFPLVKGDSFSKTTTFYIQNAGTSAATITGNFTMRDGSTYTYNSPSVGPYQMIAFTVMDATGYTLGANNRVGSLIATSAQPMAGTVMEHMTVENPATWVSSTRGFTSTDFSTKAYAPVVKNLRFGKFTGIQVQNVSAGNINVTVTYKGASRNTPCFGNTYTDTASNVAPGTAVTLVQLTTRGTHLPENCTASATIDATGNFVAIVNESYLSGYPTPVQSQGTLFALPDSSKTAEISAPLFKDDINGKRTGLQIQNVGSATATNVVATFTCRGTPAAPINFTAISQPQTVTAGGSVQFYTPSDNAGNASEPQFTPANPFARNNVNCSVIITGDQPIVAIANETSTPGYSIILDDSNYEAFNLTP